MLKEIQEVNYGAGQNRWTGNVVTGFNTMWYMKFCDNFSPVYEAHCCNYDKLASELLQQNED